MNGYVCFWNGKRIEVKAETSFQAQQLALTEFSKLSRKKIRGHEITVMIAEKSGETVSHNPAELG